MQGQRCGEASQAGPNHDDMVFIACIGDAEVRTWRQLRRMSRRRGRAYFESSPELAVAAVCLGLDLPRARRLLGLPRRSC